MTVELVTLPLWRAIQDIPPVEFSDALHDWIDSAVTEQLLVAAEWLEAVARELRDRYRGETPGHDVPLPFEVGP